MDEATISAIPDIRQELADQVGRIVGQVVPALGDLEGEPVALEGGITNRNFRVRMGGVEYVIRVPGKDTSLLGIDRKAERAANEVAAEVGVAPAVAAMLDDPECIITRFIEGRGMKAAELRESGALEDVADALRRVHAAAALPATFDSFEVVRGYGELARRRGAALPRVYDQALASAERIKTAIGGPDHDPVPCHNDLLAANFIWDGRCVRIVDWEYAGMGDRFFDLANFAVNNELDERSRQRLLANYFGEHPSATRLATLHLFTFMSDFREAMWGVLQSVVSELDFDFSSYADKHFTRLAETASDPAFDAALEDARVRG